MATALAPLVAGMTATRASLLDWVHGPDSALIQDAIDLVAAVWRW